MRDLIAKILKWQTTRLITAWKPLVIVVVGSVGKTSTTQAIAEILSSTKRVRVTRHNYNTDVGVPCSVFAQDLPDTIMNPFAWIKLFLTNEETIRNKQAFDTLVLELGTDKPGDIAEFSYLKPHLAVVTAVAPEHMEFFGDIEAVAEEELSVISFAKEVGCNKSMINPIFLEGKNVQIFDASILKNYQTKPKILGSQGEQIAAAAVWVAEKVGVGKAATEIGLSRLEPQPGRMQLLTGIMDSVLIDDTYNASPEATIAALDFLYSGKVSQRFALLGNMNELGDVSESEHRRIGKYCNPKKLKAVVTLGPDANKYLAEEAENRGCKVIRTATPTQAADVLREELKRADSKGSLILLKGSQNGVFAEEAVKSLLANREDASKLVRQSDAWLRKKAKSYKS